MLLPRRGGLLTLVLLTVVVGSVGGAVLYYGQVREGMRAQSYETLAAVAELKSRVLLDWRAAQLDHVLALASMLATSDKAEGVTALMNGVMGKQPLLSLITHVSAGGADLMVVDTAGVALWSLSGKQTAGPATLQAIAAARAGGQAAISPTFHGADQPNAMLVDVVAPLASTQGGPTTFIVLRKHLSDELSRLLGSWPLMSETGEALVAEARGDSVAVLNRPRQPERMQGQVLALDPAMPLGAGGRGHSGSFRGMDYRGETVLAEIRPVNGTGWYLVTKLDEREVLASSRSRVLMGGGIIVLMLLSGLVSSGYLLRRREVELLRELYATERRRVQEGEQLRHASASEEERLRLALEAADQGVFDLDIPSGRIDVSVTHGRMLGYDPEAYHMGLDSWRERVHPDDRQRAVEAYERCLSGAAPEYLVEFRVRTGSGEYKWILSRGRIVARAADGTPLRMLGTHTDISQRKTEEAAAQQREVTYREQRNALIELSTQSLASDLGEAEWAARFTTVAARGLDMSRASLWLFSEDGSELRCLDNHDVVAASHTSGAVLRRAAAPAYFAAVESLQLIAAPDACEDPRTLELAKDYLIPGGVRSMLDVPIQVGGRIVGVLCHEHRSEQREFRPDEQTFAIAMATLVSLELEARQRRNAEALASLRSAALEAAADAVVITDATGHIVWVNSAFAAISGYSREEACGHTPGQLLNSGRQDAAFYGGLWQTIRSGAVWRGELVNRRKNGSTYDAEMSITPIRDEGGTITHFISVKQDLTERRQLEARYLQAQKLESVGRLAGGVAHDFNNLLTVINGTADLALESVRAEDPIREEFVQIREAGGRAAALTAQLLAFSRKQPMKREVVALHDTVVGMAPMLRRLIGEDLTLAVAWDRTPVHVVGDRHQLEQVIMNLVVNARDAMSSGGRLDISVGTEDRAAVLRVADTGSGMSPESLEHIFEPFFTTKESGRGTGLGLATVHGIVAQSGGTISVSSTPGAGTEFVIRFPAAEPAAAADVAQAELLQKRAGRVLVVEDEAVVRMVAVRVLERAGYSVLQAEDGAAALRMMEEGSLVDLVMTDVVMPGISGGDLAGRIRARWPGTRVLFTSGYSEDVMPGLATDYARSFIAKPYTVEGLARKVSEVMAA